MDDDKVKGAVGADYITVDDLNLDDILTDTITIDTKDMSNFVYTNYTDPSYSYGNVTINTTAGMNGTWGSITGSTLNTSSKGLHVSTDAQFDGDVKIKGVSILETLSKIEKRLSILRPDPEKLEHFEALRKAYEHYKTLEALCELPPKEDKE